MSDADVGGTTALLVMFICRHCPYVAHVREELARLAVDYADADVAFVAISSNDPETYPEDAPESLAEEARLAGYRFPYLFDESHANERRRIPLESGERMPAFGCGFWLVSGSEVAQASDIVARSSDSTSSLESGTPAAAGSGD